ncbi:hypothetical protein MKZ07_23265 [Paenibacillus sp. FSL P4-0338]|uniref:hypothetical protein n=1 Tax=Paenibacillus sp. FSL P4-0338 TaxID=2921635 RepID=UPI0030F77C62
MTKKEASEFVGQIKQEELKLQEIEDRIESYSSKARECRNIIISLQAGEPSPDIPTKISELLNQASYYDSLAEHTMHTERYTQIQNYDFVKETASRIRHTLMYNKGILSNYLESLDDIKQTAKKMIIEAEQKINNVEFLITQQERELIALEGECSNG